MYKLFFLIGSSGSGKTTVAQFVESMKIPKLVICRSDSLPVPSNEKMIAEYGSTDEWQKANTIKWVKKIKEEYLGDSHVLFDTQSRPSFISEACKNNGIISYKIILLDCSNEERKKRLIGERNNPELANEKMMDWARYLREACTGENCQIIDNTNLSPAQSVATVLEIIS